MNTVPMITPNLIQAISGLENRPVFFLTFANSRVPNLVVKGDALRGSVRDVQASVKWSSKLMKNINNRLVNSKPMNFAEIDVFSGFIKRNFLPTSRQYKYVIDGRNDFVWVKMPFVPGLTDAEYRNDDDKLIIENGEFKNKFDTAKAKEALSKLLSEHVWQELGKIVAVDIFNGNADRFNPSNGEWANQGNLMFVKNNGQLSPIGLDTFDPSAMIAGNDYTGCANSNLMKTETYEPLRTLSEAGYRQQFARKCLRGVGIAFQNVFKTNGLGSISLPIKGGDQSLNIRITVEELDDFFLMYLSDFENGLAMGADQLKLYLQNKARQYSRQLNNRMANAARIGGARPYQPPVQTLAPARPQIAAPNSLPVGVVTRMKFLNW